MSGGRLIILGFATAALALLGWGCTSWAHEGLEVATLPSEVQPDYALFARRCSKCHSLARPLTSGIDDDAYWLSYVTRMRRQPASGISEEDAVVILRFLHYFSVEERRKSGKLPAPPAAPPPPAPLASPLPVAPPAAGTPGDAPQDHGQRGP